MRDGLREGWCWQFAIRVLLASALAMGSGFSHGVDYFVDSANGNDNWSGRLGVASGSPATDGPWQSLKRVNDATFLPGDTIRLKCGGVWRETLKPKSSGTAANPIVVLAYPGYCAIKPSIDGTSVIPSSSWTHVGSGIYRANLPINLTAAQSLSSGPSGWRVWSQGSDAILTSSSDCGPNVPPCLRATSGAAGQTILYSYRFPIRTSGRYTLRFSTKGPVGASFRALVRRGSEPWDVVGASQRILGDGAWATYSLSFAATTSLDTARIDFEIPGGNVAISVDAVSVEYMPSDVLGVYVDDRGITEAHHPNAGHDSLRPESIYFRTGADSAADVSPGSTYAMAGADLSAVSRGEILPGQVIRIRSRPWQLDERIVTSFDGTRIGFDRPTTYPLRVGSGYFLMGSLWMLDEPGEWIYDAAARAVSVWMPDGDIPGDRVSIATLATGFDLRGLSWVTVQDLAVRGVGVGIRMGNSNGIVVRRSAITDTTREGIEISTAYDGVIDGNRIERTGGDAISRDIATMIPQRMAITNNALTQSGIQLLAGGRRSIPVPSAGAIQAGENATVSGNTLSQSSFHGIVIRANSEVSGNVIRQSCMLIDDCGGIYMYGTGINSNVTNNVILDLKSTSEANPEDKTHTVGIYLDEQTSGVTVRGNSVAFSDYGVQLHDASANLIEGNTLYGNRKYQLWLVENTSVTRASGDVFGNVVRSNRIFPTATNPGVFLSTDFATVAGFGTFDMNTHSVLMNPYVVREKNVTTDLLFTLAAWRLASSNSAARNLEPMGVQIAQAGYTSYEVAGSNLLENGNLSSGLASWQSWNQIAPMAQMVMETDGSRRWLKFTAGGSSSLLFPGNFSVVADRWYRITFDMKTGSDNQRVVVNMARGGGGSNGYELLYSPSQYFFGGTSWKRYSMMVKSDKTINFRDPITGDYGARINFQQIQSGQVVYLANVEVVPMRAVGASLQTNFLVNTGSTPKQVDCPDALTYPSSCTLYVAVSNGARVVWPRLLQARSSEIIYTRDDSLIDSDSDGIPDAQDFCPGTPAGNMANARGCSLTQ